MFKSLKKKNAPTEEMAKEHNEIKTFKSGLQKDHDAIRAHLVNLHQEALSGGDGGDVAAKIKTAKAKLEELSLKIEACESGMQTLKERIATRLPVEAKTREDEIDATLQVVEGEKRELTREYLKAFAETWVIWERMYGNKGRTFTLQLPGEMLAEVACKKTVLEIVDAARAKTEPGSTVAERRRVLIQERGALREFVRHFDPAVEVEKVINSFRTEEVQA